MAVVSAPSDLLIFLFIQDKPTELLTLNLQFFILLLSYALGCVFLCIHFVPQYFCITDGIQPQFQIIASEILCAWPLPFTSATSTSISLKTPLLYYVESLCCCHLVAKLCPNLCDHMNCSLPGSYVYEILQVRILELVVIPFSRGFSQPRDTHTHRHIYTHYNILYQKCIYIHTWCVHAQSLSCVQLFATPSTIAHQAPLSMGFARQEYWSWLPFPPPGNLPNPGIKPASPVSPASAGRFFTTAPPGKPI